MLKAKNLLSLLVGGLLSMSAGVASVKADSSSILFTSDFESGVLNDSSTQSPSQGWQRGGNMPVISQDHARDGKYSAKAYLNKASSSTPYRTMILSSWNTTSDTGNRTSPHAPFFKDSWIGFSMYLPGSGAGNWRTASNTYEILAQWHDSHDPYPPPGWDTEESKNPLASIAVSDSTHAPALHWSLGYLGESRTPYPTLGSPRPWRYESGQTADLGPIDSDLDKWTDWVIHIRWNFWKVGSSGNSTAWDPGVYDNVAGSPNSGTIEVWKNGVLVFQKSPVQIGSNDNAGAFFTAGLYKGWRDQPQRDGDPVNERTMYFDAFKYAVGTGATYADVAPGGQPASSSGSTTQNPKPSTPVSQQPTTNDPNAAPQSPTKVVVH